MIDPDFVAHCLELLAPVGAPRSRRMFGGHGFYIDDLFVAILAHDGLYMKVDDTSREAFREAGGRPFTFDGKDGTVQALGFWTPPEEAMESPREMIPWARRALAAAVAARGAKKPKAPRRGAAKKAAATKKTVAAKKKPAAAKKKPAAAPKKAPAKDAA
jgi:DNA transformation protein